MQRQREGTTRLKKKESIESSGEREGERRWGGVDVCVYLSLSFFDETVVCFWRQLKLTEALNFCSHTCRSTRTHHFWGNAANM